MKRICTIIAAALALGGCNTTQYGVDANGNRLAYASKVDFAAMAAGVPTHIAHAVIKQESGYRPHVRSHAGALGIGQIKCQTARGEGFTGSCRELFDPDVNLTYSMRYLRKALDKGGEGCAGISLYERGVYARARCTAYGRAVERRAQ